jgi:phosphate transport system permease protein
MTFSKTNKDIKSLLFVSLVRVLFFILLGILILIISKIFIEGIGVINFQFLFDEPKNNMTSGGIGPAIFGTLAVTILMLLFSLPLGICTAVYLSEYAKDTLLNRIIRASINNLAGVPSIVYGLFGLGFFVLFIGKNIDSVLKSGLLFGQPVMLWAASTLAILVLPIIVVSTQEALNSVPKSHRDAAYGLGATKWQVIKSVVLPEAKSGILTGTILAVSRGIGETAPILFLGAAFYLPNLPIVYLCFGDFCLPMINPAEQFMHISYHIFILATQSSNPTVTLPLQYGSALVLIGLTLFSNIVAIYFRYKFRKTERKG